MLEILTPIWHVKAPTARHVHQRIRTVLEWAVAMEFRTDNPCDRIGPILGAQNDVVTHMRALPHRDVASAIETVRGSGTQPVVKLAFEFVKRRTRREIFLEKMEGLIPWQQLEDRIEPFYPKAGRGRRPYPLGVMLRGALCAADSTT